MTTVIPSLGRSGWRWLPLVLLVIVADQLSKGWIEANYLLGESTAVLPWLDIIRLHNPGAAFSFLAGAGGWQRWFFIFEISILVSSNWTSTIICSSRSYTNCSCCD